MTNAREVLDNWASEQYKEWYALDEMMYDGSMRRTMVGTFDEVQREVENAMFNEDAGSFANAPFFRIQMVDADAACLHFAACAGEIQGETVGKLLTVSEAAAATGRTRQAIHDLVKRGRLHCMDWAGELRIDGTELAAFRPYYK